MDLSSGTVGAPGQSDRAAGVVLGQATGDALGAPYEFGAPLPDGTAVLMSGGGGFRWAPGEWTDDTDMSIPLLEAAERALREGGDLLDHLDEVAEAWWQWSRTATDVGIQTRAVLAAAAADGPVTAAALRAASTARHDSTGRSGGNGSLMRTAPVALAYLHDRERLAFAARAVSDLTHPDPDAGDACVLWCEAIRRAVITGDCDIRAGLDLLDDQRRDRWLALIEEAERNPPAHFSSNGWVVQALQGAWSAISRTPVPDDSPELGSYPAQHLQHALEAAVRGGRDTDTVAAIAGALLGARWGASAVPQQWRGIVHGWPGISGAELASRGMAVAQRISDPGSWPLCPRYDYSDWPVTGFRVPHPHDPGVVLGDVMVLDDLPPEIDAVVSLCRVGREQPAGLPSDRRVEVRLIDSSAADDNPHLDFVIADAADTVAALRAEGRTVLLHCVATQSRTPTVAAAYSIRHLGVQRDTALREVCAVLPAAAPNAAFTAALARVAAPRS